MICKPWHNHYTTRITVCGKSDTALFDTGAARTVLAFSTAMSVFNCTREKLEKIILEQGMVDIQGATSDVRHKGLLCSIPDVSMGSDHIDTFYCVICPVVTFSVIGFDFIDACRIRKDTADSILVSLPDMHIYERNARGNCNSTAVNVVSLLNELDNPVEWFYLLSDLDKRKVERYSYVLYSALNTGQFYEELRPLYNGVRELYNI